MFQSTNQIQPVYKSHKAPLPVPAGPCPPPFSTRSSKGLKGAPSSIRRSGLLSFMEGTGSPWSRAKPMSLPPGIWEFG